MLFGVNTFLALLRAYFSLWAWVGPKHGPLLFQKLKEYVNWQIIIDFFAPE